MTRRQIDYTNLSLLIVTGLSLVAFWTIVGITVTRVAWGWPSW